MVSSSSSSMPASLKPSFRGVEGGDAFRQHQAHNQDCGLHRLGTDLPDPCLPCNLSLAFDGTLHVKRF